MLAAAREAGGPGHHFLVLQLPMNLFEGGGVLERNTGPDNQQTVLEAAVEAGVDVLVNRPLNAIVGDRMLRLASFDVKAEPIDIDAQLKVVADLEAEWRQRLAPNIQTSPKSLAPDHFFRWADQLQSLSGQLESLEHWEHIEGQMIMPQLTQLLATLDNNLTGELQSVWQSWRARYLEELAKPLAEFRRQGANKSQRQSAAISAVIDPLLPAERRAESLSRKALWVLTSTPGVSCVLNGMRRPAYVEDSLGILAWSPLAEVVPIYHAIQTLRLPHR
jgi:hypothetical protein